MSSMDARPRLPTYLGLLRWGLRDGVRPRSSQHGRGGAPHISSAPTQGHPSPGRSAPPCFAAESVRADTLRAHPENAAAPAQYPSAERRYRPYVTSGCPKRSEGGSPVGTRTITVFPCGAKLSTVSPSRAAHPVRKPRRGSEPSGPPPARTYPSRPAHPEERAGWRHRSSPRRARVQRLHARRRQPQG